MDKWLPIDSAPKGATPQEPWKEHWILGTNGMDCRVIRWCMEYPLNEGGWIYDEYVVTEEGCYDSSEFAMYYPTHWMPLPELPKKEKGIK